MFNTIEKIQQNSLSGAYPQYLFSGAAGAKLRSFQLHGYQSDLVEYLSHTPYTSREVFGLHEGTGKQMEVNGNINPTVLAVIVASQLKVNPPKVIRRGLFPKPIMLINSL